VVVIVVVVIVVVGAEPRLAIEANRAAGDARALVAHLDGQLAGRNHTRLDGGARSDGTPDRVLAQWTVRGEAGSQVTVEARHQRAGVARDTIRLGG